MRTAAAMYSNIQDCDEGEKSLLDIIPCLMSAVFNFWEPLHYLHRGYGFQTWETAPIYAIRSWAYILLHLPVAKVVTALLGIEKVNDLIGRLRLVNS